MLLKEAVNIWISNNSFVLESYKFIIVTYISGGEVLPVYATNDGHMVTLVKEHSALPASSYSVSDNIFTSMSTI